jgi:hydrogenase expression/formation protein HypD
VSTQRVEELTAQIAATCEKLAAVRIMEVCGTHTVSIFRNGIRSLLPATLRLVSGPGCPVCVTAQRHIDASIELAQRDGVVVATYGDMMRVPGRQGNLEQCRARGAHVHVIQSARTALQLARLHPDHTVVFVAVGFETTAPATAATILEAAQSNVQNFAVLMAHKLVVPAMSALLDGGDIPLDGFLCPGHVSVIIGADAYRPIADGYGKACVVAGFEPEQILAGLAALVRLIADGRGAVENVYSGVVGPSGNHVALDLLDRVFVHRAAPWRALGTISDSGLELAPEFEGFDALKRFGIRLGPDEDDPECRCGEVIQGKLDPDRCSLFGRRCTPLHPVGPCMVSSEGTCAAWYKYGRRRAQRSEPREVPS